MPQNARVTKLMNHLLVLHQSPSMEDFRGECSAANECVDSHAHLNPTAFENKMISAVNVSSSSSSPSKRTMMSTPMGFDEWHVGQELSTKKRTISETDIVNYVQMTGYQAENLFGDMEYLKKVGHAKRMAPALLTTSIADALIVGSGALEGYAIALLGVTDLKATAPVYAGDTIHVTVQVTAKKESRSKPDRGIVTTKQQVVNQDGQVVVEYYVSRMLRKKSILE